MARIGSALRRPSWHRSARPAARSGERGATLSEYVMLVSLVVVTSIGAINHLSSESGSYLVDTGSDIGTPRALAADIDPDLPEAPAWLTQPPAPTTTTTTSTTTTTTSTTTPSSSTTTTSTTAGPTTTTAPPTTTTTTAPPTTTTTAPTTTTTAPTYPTGGVIYQGSLSSRNNPDKCFQVVTPGQIGSDTDRHNCDNGADQDMAAVGTAAVVALRFTDAPNNGLCLAASGGTVLMATCNGSTAQLFTVTVNGSGHITFTSQLDGSCLTERSGGLRLESCGGSSRQKFTF